MTATDLAFPVRPGEHACCRSGDPRDRERLLSAFVRAGLARGHKVVHLCDRCDRPEVLARLSADDAIDAAIASGRLEVRDTQRYAQAGSFDAERMVQRLRDEHARALADGYSGLSICGDVGAQLHGVAGDRVVEYEHRLDAGHVADTQVLLCQYDHPAFDERTLTEVSAVHRVVVSPVLAAIGRAGVLAAARVRDPETLRLAGELDFEAAGDVAGALEAEFPGPRRVDAADLEYIDVAGLRALRGREGGPLTISGASERVRGLVELMGWDTDPSVRVLA
jgi:ABC-type transporter Mla MlaB component